MGARTKAMVWTVCLLASVPASPAMASEAPPSPAGTACTATSEYSTAGRQEWAAARSGRIPGIGVVNATIGWDGRKTMTLVDERFSVSRAFDPLTREVEVAISGQGEAPLVLRLGGGALRISKGARAIDVSDGRAVREALEGGAIAAFRERIGNYERRLMAGGAPKRLDDPHADAFLLVGAFISSLAGDPTAVGRARDLIVQRIRGRVRAVRFDFKDCVTDYELYLLKIDKQRTECLEAANGRESWLTRAADRLGCEIEFMAQALAGEGQFVSCTALGSIVQ